jgi:hypothetical protein
MFTVAQIIVAIMHMNGFDPEEEEDDGESAMAVYPDYATQLSEPGDRLGRGV